MFQHKGCPQRILSLMCPVPCSLCGDVRDTEFYCVVSLTVASYFENCHQNHSPAYPCGNYNNKTVH